MKSFKKTRLAALNLDGVLINDTYSPVIKNFIEKHGGIYTREIERLIWGAPHIVAGHNMATYCKLPWSAQQTIEEFFEEREEYIKQHPVKLELGVKNLLELLAKKGAKITTYEGRIREYVFKYLSSVSHYLDHETPYIDTNSIRPSVKEIVYDMFKLNFDEVLFIDDINRMAEVCRYLNAGFIGPPVTKYQLYDMENTEVKYIIPKGISEINSHLLDKLDNDLLSGTLWK